MQSFSTKECPLQPVVYTATNNPTIECIPMHRTPNYASLPSNHFCVVGGTSPSSPKSALLPTKTYSASSPSLGPGVGGSAPPVVYLPSVTGALNSAARGLVGCSLNVFSPSGTRGRGLDLPDGLPAGFPLAAAFSRSSVAFSLASRASSSEVCVETAFFLRGVCQKGLRLGEEGEALL